MKIDDIAAGISPSEIRLRILYPSSETPNRSKQNSRLWPTTDLSIYKPVVPISGPTLLVSDAAVELGKVLSKHGFYNYVGEAACLAADGLSLDVLSPERFRNVIEKHVTPVRIVDVHGTQQPQNLDSADSKEILASELFVEQLLPVEHFNVRRLPVLTDDGHFVLLEEGYDGQHRVLTARPSVNYRTDKSLAEAQEVIELFLGNFPFADEQTGKAATLSMMLTPFIAEFFPAKTIVPAFLCNGDRPGLGKNLLVQLAMIPTLGSAPATVKAKDEEEMRKLLLAVAREGRRAIFFDNVSKLTSPSLESFITTPTVTGRVLGKTETITCPKSTVVFATGNNCVLSDDMQRRTVIVQLASRENAQPIPTGCYLDEPRINEATPMILGALYTFVREWAAADQPKPVRINPNFARWSEIVGGIISHAGFVLPY